MDLLGIVLQDNDLANFLKGKRREEKIRIIQKLVSFGVRALGALESAGLYHSLQHNKENELIVKAEKKKNVHPDWWPADSKRESLRNKDTRKRSVSIISYAAPKAIDRSTRRIPKSLANVDSKIKEQVREYRKNAIYRASTPHRNASYSKVKPLSDEGPPSSSASIESSLQPKPSWKPNKSPIHVDSELKNENVVYRTATPLRDVSYVKDKSLFEESSSSISSYKPSDEMKEFFHQEYSRLLPEDVPRHIESLEDLY